MSARLVPLLALLLSSVVMAAPVYEVQTVASGLDHPWSLAFLPDGAMLVTERAGRLRLIENGALRDAPVSGVPAAFVAGQAGLFDVFVDRQFASNRRIYLSFAHGDADANRLRVISARYGDRALDQVQVIFEASPAKLGDAHYGGRIAQLADDTLVIGVGEGFIYREAAQDLRSHLGKFVRVAPDGGVPADNPFGGRDDARAEIYSFGHRNPQGVVFDPRGGVLYAHEHGPRGGDELNLITPGSNYGWPLATRGIDYTGARISPWREYEGSQPPLLHWTPSIAPAGMALYRGERFPAWKDSLLVATLVEKSVRRIALVDGVPGAQETLFTELGERLRDVRSGPDGAIYLLTDRSDGRVLRVVPAR